MPLQDLPDPMIKARSPALQADSLPSEPPKAGGGGGGRVPLIVFLDLIISSLQKKNISFY